MRFNTVQTSPSFTCTCKKCARRLQVADGSPAVYADADGVAFEAYYCAECAKLEAYSALRRTAVEVYEGRAEMSTLLEPLAAVQTVDGRLAHRGTIAPQGRES
uniref:Uncharacterized protein n=1 Tax=viral metagenome TaxID=1070528 RepID=A0A6M3K7C4_9ZZZZ